jgi:transcription antitermination factor NusG
MGIISHPAQNLEFLPPIGSALWFAVHTYPRHEKRVSSHLTLKGVENHLPLIARVHQWSDRRKEVDLPLFPCYVFVRILPVAERRVQVLQAPGVIGLVGSGGEGTPIPERQIEDIRTLLKNKVLVDPYPFLKIGQRVRIRGSYLDGVEGILIRRHGMRRLIISVDAMERSFSICVEGLEVEAI